VPTNQHILEPVWSEGPILPERLIDLNTEDNTEVESDKDEDDDNEDDDNESDESDRDTDGSDYDSE
jgi:hypothetical protein